MALVQLDSELWVTTQSLRFGGIDIGTRMTVIRLGNGSLFLHSPVPIGRELRRELDDLGPVSCAAAPNRFHHLYIGGVKEQWPDARLFAAPGLEQKRTDIAWHGVLGDEPPAEWAGELEQVFFDGFPLANEIVFYHPSSRTLLLTDTAFHVGPEAPRATRLAFRLLRAYDRFGPTFLERFLIRDRAAARRSLDAILDWDFDRVVVAHGAVLETGGRQRLRAAYQWLD